MTTHLLGTPGETAPGYNHSAGGPWTLNDGTPDDGTPDETIAGLTDGAGGAETEIVASSIHHLDTPAAWSQCDYEPEVSRPPWLDVAERATYIVMAGLSTAVIVSVGGWFLLHRNDDHGFSTSVPQTIPASALAAISSAPPPPPPVDIHSLPPTPPQTVTVQASPPPQTVIVTPPAATCANSEHR